MQVSVCSIASESILYSYFDYDNLNRLTAHRTKRAPFAGVPSWLWSKRSHQYDATGRLVKSNYKTWTDGQQEPSGDTLEHIYAGAKHVQNYDGTNYGAVWHWAGAANEHMGPLNSPNADTASQKGYNLSRGGADVAAGAGGMYPQRRSPRPVARGYALSRPAGRRALARDGSIMRQGRPMAKDSSGSGSAWAAGTTSQRTGMTGYRWGGPPCPPTFYLMFEGTVTGTDMSRATDAREKDRIGILGTGLSYAGSYGRVTSETIGRDLNPLGRGSGFAVVGGALASGFGLLSRSLPGATLSVALGNSVNNPLGLGGSGGTATFITSCSACCAFALCLKPTVTTEPCDCDVIMEMYRELGCFATCDPEMAPLCNAFLCSAIIDKCMSNEDSHNQVFADGGLTDFTRCMCNGVK